MFLISGSFNAEKGNDEHNKISLYLLVLVAEVEVLHDPIVYCLSKIRFQGSKIRIFSIHTALLESDEKLSTSFQNDQNDQKRLLKQKRSEVLYYDGQQLQERLSEMFLAVLGESLISLLEESYDPENAGAILVSFLVLLLLISIGMQFYETVGKSVTDEHAILSPFVRRHAFITMQMVVTFCLWVASCGMVGLYSHVLFILPGKNSHSKQSVAPTSYPTSHPSSALDDDRNSYNDYYYYFYYADLSTEKVYLPSVSLAEWQVAIGLCLTELCCMLLRLMHVYQQRMVLMYRTELENRNQGANHSRSQNAVLGTLVPHTHQALPAHCTKMEIIYFLAAITHLCIFFFFERISSAHTATFFAFTAHSLVNIIVCSVYLFRRFAVEEKEDEEHLSRISNLLSAVKYVSPMQHQMSMPKSKSALVHDVEEELRQAVAANDDNEDKEEDDIDGHD